jgi:AcrR family transcriptional regulator
VARLANPELADRRRRQIMDAAIACFRRRGFHQATMQEICAEADISAGALYRYFASKAVIIGAIDEDSRSEGDDALNRTLDREGIIAALCHAAQGFLQKFADGDGALIADIIAEGIRDDAIAAPLRATDAQSVKVFTKAIKQAQTRGEVDASLDAETAAHTLFSALEGIGLRRAFLRQTDPDAALEQFRTLAERFLSPPR